MATVERWKVAPRGHQVLPGGKIFIVDNNTDVIGETDSENWLNWVHYKSDLNFLCDGPATAPTQGAVYTGVRVDAIVDDWGSVLINFARQSPTYVSEGDTFTLKTPI